MLLSDLLAEYAADRPNIGACWRSQMRTAVGAFARFLRRAPRLADLERRTLCRYLASEAARSSARTANAYRQGLIALWNHAADLELCPGPRRVPKLSAPKRLPVAWSVDEMSAILAACQRVPGRWAGVPTSLAWQLACSVLWDTAARIGELLAARCADVDLIRGEWTVRAEAVKGRRADKLYRLHPDTLDLIQQSRPDSREMLFPFPWGRRRIWPHLKRILKLASLPSDRKRMFHCIRRSAESHAAAAKGEQWAADAVGHSVAVARDHYIAPTIAPKPALVDALPRPLSPARFRVVG